MYVIFTIIIEIYAFISVCSNQTSLLQHFGKARRNRQ